MLHGGSRWRARLDLHVDRACRWVERACAHPSGVAHDGWSITSGWRPPTTRATAIAAIALCRAARAEACRVDTTLVLRCGGALLARQRKDGSFEPIGSLEEEEPATSLSVDAMCALHELTGDDAWRAAASRGALRLLAARARPTSALALSAAWSCTADERLWNAAREGLLVAQHRLTSRAKAPLSSVREAVDDLDVVVRGMRRLGDDVEPSPAALAASAALISRLEASSGSPSSGYTASGAVTRTGVDHETNARAADLAYALDGHHADPRACYAGDLAVARLCDRIDVEAWLDGARGSIGATPRSFATRTTAATGRFVIAATSAMQAAVRCAARESGTASSRRAWWSHGAPSAIPPATRGGAS